MGDLASILAAVRSLANRGAHHAIVARYGALDDTPEEETWNSTELLFEIGRAFGMLGNEEKVERYLLRCAELAPRRAAVFHCAIGWYFQRKKKWTKALRWYDRALASFPTYHLCLVRRGYCLEKLHRPRETVDALSRAREIWDKAPTEQRQRGRGVQVQVLFHLSRALRDLGEFDAAAEALDTCCALDHGSDPPAIRPEHVLANRGELNLRRSDLAAAAAAFQAARALDPASSYLCERLGRVHELAGDTAAAEAAYRDAAALPRPWVGLRARQRAPAVAARPAPSSGPRRARTRGRRGPGRRAFARHRRSVLPGKGLRLPSLWGRRVDLLSRHAVRGGRRRDRAGYARHLRRWTQRQEGETAGRGRAASRLSAPRGLP